VKQINLKERLKQNKIIIAPGAHDALSAKIITQNGFDAVYVSGSGISASYLGKPDIGLLTQTEMVMHLSNITSITSLPVIADADTGYGNVNNVARTVKDYEKAGVDALHLEDQVFPKRCGHFEGKQLISKKEMIGKIKVAVENRMSPNFLIIARTDACSVYGITKAIDRALAYVEAGADIIFIEAPTSMSDVKLIPQKIDVPLMYDITEGGKSPILTAGELENLGYSIVTFSCSAIRACMKTMQKLFKKLKQEKTTTGMEDIIIGYEARNQLLELNKFINNINNI